MIWMRTIQCTPSSSVPIALPSALQVILNNLSCSMHFVKCQKFSLSLSFCINGTKSKMLSFCFLLLQEPLSTPAIYEETIDEVKVYYIH